MVYVVAVLAAVFGISASTLLWLFLQAKRSLSHFRGIEDVERYQAECEAKSQAALAETARLHAEGQVLKQQFDASKARLAQYQQLLGTFKSAADLHHRIEADKLKARQLMATLGGLERASQLEGYIRGQQATISGQKAELAEIAKAINGAKSAGEIVAQVTYYENYLAQLKADIESVEEAGELQEFGFYRPRFDFETPDAYKVRLASIRSQQKGMLKNSNACVCHTEWTVDGNKREGQKMVNQQVKLMLRAFNGECDAAVEKVRYNNIVALEKRIEKSFEAINKLGETKKIHLVHDYLNLKITELHLAHEYQEKKQEDREEQQRIREQMREEEKVAKEIEQAKEDAERDEAIRMKALEKARAELAATEGKHTEKLAALVAKLENELQDALDRKAKAIARAQLTRSGHVYILSNLGTFGDGVYKIGLTRRLEPLERVKELGGAAVPFPFDVHAMIYSEDAPKLENILHRHFAARRVNMVNLRREFFRVTLDEIRAAVAEHYGHITFVTVPQAEQYRKTLAMAKEATIPVPPLQIA